MKDRKSQPPAAIRSRIVGEGYEAPDQLLANPLNWRRHPKAQLDALEGMLDTVGWVQRVIVNRTTGHMVDGHARTELALRRNEATIPVLYVELTEAEEKVVLASLDPLGDLALTDVEQLAEVLDGMQAQSSEGLQSLLDDLARTAGIGVGETGLPALRDGDRDPFQQMTFTVHDDQKAVVDRALAAAKAMGAFSGPNENGNGNALARVCEQFLQHHA